MGKSFQFNIERAQTLLQIPEQGSMPLPEIRTFSNRYDYTLLQPNTAFEQIDELCEEATEYGFKVSS